ncbi:hypothetical protein O181_027717 [Austropuccinia psidii MF-1]|uniref:Amidohydrolase 3 domain-containing protein n=1 Tax=Austropuccinia psidii MF-1 TaxID=1389203 RepID=A0A9Q3CQI8_9BASI|nr:hypothetical protein [Austropuccinia psidii MF-1]
MKSTSGFQETDNQAIAGSAPARNSVFWRGVFICSLIVLVCSIRRCRYPLTMLWKSSNELIICTAQGSIYTSDDEKPFAECLGIDGGIITFLGKKEDLESSNDYLTLARGIPKWSYVLGLARRAPPILMLNGAKSILPGLIDSHAHPLEHGAAKSAVNLAGCTSTEAVVERLIHYIQSSAELVNNRDKFILGNGWDQSLFVGKRFPTASDLASNSILVGRKIVLRRIDFHAYWVSSAVLNLALANFTKPDVPGGQIIRDERGQPTGVFVDNAMSLVNHVLPNRTDQDRLEYLKSTADEMWSVGLTGVHDAAADPSTVEFYKKLDVEDSLPVRVSAMVDCDNIYCGNRVEKYEGSKFSFRSVKLFVDGALGSWGAALWEPYSDKPLSSGILRSPEETFLPLIQQWVDAGFQVCAHAIGDRANSIVLDAYEEVLKQLNLISDPRHNSLRLRIEHAQIIRPADLSRLGKLNVIASVQPTHAIADMDYAEARLGSGRMHGAYAWNSLLKNNVTLALGSDFPVSSLSPFLGIHAAFTRTKPVLRTSQNSKVEGWYPDERIETMEEIIQGFTIHASFAGFNEHKVGSLAIGKRADLVIIDRNLFDYEKSREEIGDEILNVRVLTTILDGKVVYGKLSP